MTHRRRSDDAESSHESCLRELCSQHESAIFELQRTHESLTSESQSCHQATISGLQFQHETEMNELQSRHATDLAERRQNEEQAAAATAAQLARQLQAAEDEKATHREAEAGLSQQLSTVQADIDRLKVHTYSC